MRAPTNYTNATHRFTNFTAMCNDCAWYSPANPLCIDVAVRHAKSKHHNVTIITSTHAIIYGASAKT